MIVGDPSLFAIESNITEGFFRLSFRGLGFFVIHVNGRRYGVYEPDASMLACSFESVNERLAARGSHTAPFASLPDASKIAYGYRQTFYSPVESNEPLCGVPRSEFRELIVSQQITWAPDGDEAFDDGSYVLQFDVGDKVRLIAFKSAELGHQYDPGTLSDRWLGADQFYGILQQWRDKFEAEWRSMPKIAESDDGAEPKEQA